MLEDREVRTVIGKSVFNIIDEVKICPRVVQLCSILHKCLTKNLFAMSGTKQGKSTSDTEKHGKQGLHHQVAYKEGKHN